MKRRSSEDNLSSDLEGSALRPLSELADDEHFSDDSLEEMLPPPPPVTNKRASIAWEVLNAVKLSSQSEFVFFVGATR